ncbi:MAG: galactokinase [Spirochaetales bacterium]|nr:galactokinase [Spirochaetales bacterium]
MDTTGLYGKHADAERARKRIADLEKQHLQLFGTKSRALFSTAGRTELGGNHTDHNLGKVLAGSINLDTIAAVHAVPENRVTFISEGYPKLDVDISDTKADPALFGTTEALIRGVAHAMAKRGGRTGGFCANVSSSVLKGSGLSSSASVEVLLGTIFNSLYNDDRFSTTELAIMGQEAENIHFGKPSGLMDQLACANGGIVGIDFRNPAQPAITPVAIDFADYGYDLVITTTGGNHADLTDDYASIPSEMKAVARFFGKKSLSEVSEIQFMNSIGELRKALGNDRAIIRAGHFFAENRRVDAMIAALKDKDIPAYLALVRETGDSSFKFLQNIFSPKAPEGQGIALACAMTDAFLKGEGACRVQGGGFAGTIEAYIPCDRTASYFAFMEKTFGKDCCTTLAIRNLPTMRIG